MINKKLIAITVAIFSGFSIANAQTQQKARPTIQLKFPEKLVGSVSLLWDGFNEPNDPVWSAKAAGTVNVPLDPKTIVCLDLNNEVLKNPGRLKSIPIKGIQALHLGMLSMTDEEADATNNCLAKIGRFKEIKSLFLDSSDASDEAFKVVESLPNLRLISVEATRVNGSCFKSFAKVPNLSNVNAQRCHLDEANFKYLAQCPKLEKLELRWTNISSTGLRMLAQSKSLRYLRLGKEKNFSDSDSAIVASMPQLQEVCLELNPALTNRTVESLSRLKNLRFLNLSGTHLDDKCTPNLKKLNKLEYLNVVNTAITETGLLQLNCPNLKWLEISANRFRPGYRDRLTKAFPKLRWNMRPHGNSNDDDVNFLLGQ